MKVLELFSGTESFSKVARQRGHETFTVDIDPELKPSMVADIRELEVEDLPEEWQSPDVVWASPDCRCFSIMVIAKNWKREKGRFPVAKTERTKHFFKLAEKTFSLIKEIAPSYYFIENPMGMMRKMPFTYGWHKSTVTYCQYGFPYQKKTDIWNNCYEWRPRPVCSPRSPCNVRAPRGSKLGVQGVMRYKGKQREHLHPVDIKQEVGWNAALQRAVIPPALCEEILIACEKGLLIENQLAAVEKEVIGGEAWTSP